MQTQQAEQETGTGEELEKLLEGVGADTSELQTLFIEGVAMIGECPQKCKSACKGCRATAFLRRILRMLVEGKDKACLRLCREREIRNKFDLVAIWYARLLVHSKEANGRKPEDITEESLRALASMTP